MLFDLPTLEAVIVQCLSEESGPGGMAKDLPRQSQKNVKVLEGEKETRAGLSKRPEYAGKSGNFEASSCREAVAMPSTTGSLSVFVKAKETEGSSSSSIVAPASSSNGSGGGKSARRSGQPVCEIPCEYNVSDATKSAILHVGNVDGKGGVQSDRDSTCGGSSVACITLPVSGVAAETMVQGGEGKEEQKAGKPDGGKSCHLQRRLAERLPKMLRSVPRLWFGRLMRLWLLMIIIMQRAPQG